MFQALGSSTSYDGSNGSPLSWHKLGQMKKLLLFFSGPFCLLNTGVQPLVPAQTQTWHNTSNVNKLKISLLSCWMKTHHLALHCLADLRCSREAIRDHWFFPYFITAALRISSCINNEIRQTREMYYRLHSLHFFCNSLQIFFFLQNSR